MTFMPQYPAPFGYAQGGTNATTQGGAIQNLQLFEDVPNCVARRIPRNMCTIANLTDPNTTGRVCCAAIQLAAGMVVSNITIVSGTTAATVPTHSWMALLDSTLHVLAVSADGGGSFVTNNTPTTYAMTAAFTIVTTGTYYIAFSFTGTTAPSLTGGAGALAAGVSNSTGWPSNTVIECGTAGTQTTPPALNSQINSGTIASVSAQSNFAAWIT